MLSGGPQEPRDVIALTLWALLSNREQFERIRADRSLVKAAVEETLRWAGPVGTATRQTTREVELAGVARARRVDRRGALVGQPRPAPVADPDRFDVRRMEGAHLASRPAPTSASARGSDGTWLGSPSTSRSIGSPVSSSTPTGR
jgi:cytochrome P450